MRLVIIEDEPLTADDLAQTIKQLYPSSELLGIFPSVKKSVAFFETQPQVDLVFSDIQLLDGPSFEIFRTVSISAPVIFCTAFNEFALEAFKANGIDYVLKPFSTEAIKQALQKYESLKQNFLSTETTQPSPLQKLVDSLKENKSISTILVHYREKIIPVKLEEIALFYKQNEITYLKTFAGKSFAIDQTLDQLEQSCGSNFFRISRQCIVNHASIRETEHTFNRKLIVHLNVANEMDLDVSRNRVSPFLEWLAQ
jgi:DNA-binding LytR/AlgR family response regulator